LLGVDVVLLLRLGLERLAVAGEDQGEVVRRLGDRMVCVFDRVVGVIDEADLDGVPALFEFGAVAEERPALGLFVGGDVGDFRFALRIERCVLGRRLDGRRDLGVTVAVAVASRFARGVGLGLVVRVAVPVRLGLDPASVSGGTSAASGSGSS
jgi:hypothetical protein